MNIFILDNNPVNAAVDQCDRHVCKMLLESTQMLCLALPASVSPYKQAYQDHPCSKWALESQENYNWLRKHAWALYYEYMFRYGNKNNNDHKCKLVLETIDTWHKNNSYNFPNKGLTPFAQAMPDQYKNSDAVTAYRAYYLGDKQRFAKWKNGRTPPDWWK